jgi:hypothetical protein
MPGRAGIPVHLGALLREIYDSTLTEPIPERFLKLLRDRDTACDPARENSAHCRTGSAGPQ